MNARNALYDRGVFKTHPLGARVISIGNITTGGTGKTPLVALVADILAESGETVCILTRGYGRSANGRVVVSDGERVLADAKTGGDEPVELAHKLLGKAIVIADAERVAAAKFAKEKWGATAFVLDDGFQHRRAKRDLDIVCIDATDPVGNGCVLPAGRLREPLKNLRRADAVMITRADLVEDLSALRYQISDLRSQIFTSQNQITGFAPLEQLQIEPPSTQSMCEPSRPFVFCGLGNPENFFDQLKRDALSLVGTRSFADHHYYTKGDIDDLHREAKAAGAESFITTAKDAVKLTEVKFEIPCYVAIAETVIDDIDTFRSLVRGR